jgi:N-acetylglucosaminyldiphosphoundecaprenol N-acetyl-beta-D-mannosaminyltransferase
MSAGAKPALDVTETDYRQILGLRFFTGSLAKAIEHMNGGGLLVVPSAPILKDLPLNMAFREALLNADLTITDSALMVLLWNVLQRDNIPRISGLAYMRELLKHEDIRTSQTFWIMASPSSAARNLDWLRSQGISVAKDDMYIAPLYDERVDDGILLRQLQARHPRHIVVTLGGGTQERLGLYLKRNLSFRPAIHCTGAAIAFLSGDQISIPEWADKYYIGWLFRCISDVRRYVPRYWSARKLLPLMFHYRDALPTFTASVRNKSVT